MQAHAARHATAGFTWKLAQGLRALASTMRSGARHLDDWLASREQAVADRDALLAMGAHELRDIGLDPSRFSSRSDVAWTRDWSM